MCVLEKEYYSLEDLADKWDYTISDLLYLGEKKELQMCTVLPPTLISDNFLVKRTGSCRFSGLCSIYSGDILTITRGNGIITRIIDLKGRMMTTLIGHSIRLQPSDLVVTHKEKLRFEAAYDLASNTKATIHSKSTRRIRSNELHDVIWRAYCDLKKRHDAPTSGQVWQKLVNNYKKYDIEDVIDEITEKIIVWTNLKNSRRTLKESSFKGTLSHIKKKKNISKNSN